MTDVAKVTVMNTALAQLGQEPVPDLTEASLEDSLAAVKLLRVFDEGRDVVLARQGWLCALQYTTLSPVVIPNYVNWKYPTTYVLPGDGVGVWEIGGWPLTDYYGGYWRQRWELGTLDTDMGPQIIIRARNFADALNVAYMRRCSWGALTIHLRDAVAFEIAARGCNAVTGDMNLAKKLEAAAERKVQMALSTEAKQIEGEETYAPSIPDSIRRYAESGGDGYGWGGGW